MQAIEDFYPLSSAQQGILFHTLYTPNTRVYLQQLTTTLCGEIEPRLFEQSWQEVLNRHPSLRSSFRWIELKEPVQVVHKQVSLPLEYLDWRALEPDKQQQQLERLLDGDREKGFQLADAPLMRLMLIRMSEHLYEFVWSYHHILMDGWSISLVQKEALAHYEAFKRGGHLQLSRPRPYRDYIAWLRQQDLLKAEAFWRNQLQGFLTATPLVFDCDPAELPDKEEGYHEQSAALEPACTEAILALSRQHRLTLNTFFLGAWALLLSRYSGQEEVVFGTVVSGRPPELAGIEQMVGLFINTLPIRIAVAPDAPLLDWLGGLQQQQLDMQAYEYTPLVQIQAWSEIGRGEGLFQSLFAFENYPVNDLAAPSALSLEVTHIRTYERTSYPLTIMVGAGSTLMLRVLYDSRVLSPSRITTMLDHLRVLLGQMAADPRRDLAAISMLSASESRQFLDDFNMDLEDEPV